MDADADARGLILIRATLITVADRLDEHSLEDLGLLRTPRGRAPTTAHERRQLRVFLTPLRLPLGQGCVTDGG